MNQKIKITSAYCIELDKVVEIDEIHNESLKTKPSQRFTFLCSSLPCRSNGVKITGVSYHLPISEQQRIMHFRENSKYLHDESCEWVIFNNYLHHTGKHLDETDLQAEIRQKTAQSNVNDWITHYVPYFPDSGVKTSKTTESIKIMDKNHATKTSNQETQTKQYSRRTHSFFRLCQFHHDMNQLHGISNLKNIPLHIAGIGQTNFGAYFQLIGTALYRQNCVLFGWVNIKRYGTGFKVFFKQKYEKHTITIYISSEQIDAYRHKRQLLDVLNHVDEFKYLTAYVVPNEIQPYQDSLQIMVTNLDYLRFIPTMK